MFQILRVNRMANYIGTVFKNTQVRLDFNSFQNCRFENCTMVYGGKGPVSITECTFSNVSWAFVDAAQNTLQFMRALYHGSGESGRQLIESTFNLIRQGELTQQNAPTDLTATETVVPA